MSARRSVVVVAIMQLALALGAGSAAAAATTVTGQERAVLQRAMARYERVLGSTTTAQVVAQVRAEEARLDPCVAQLEGIYSGHNPVSAEIDYMLGMGSTGWPSRGRRTPRCP